MKNPITIDEATRLLHDKGKYISKNTVTSACRRNEIYCKLTQCPGTGNRKGKVTKYLLEFNSFRLWAFSKYMLNIKEDRVIYFREHPDNYRVN